MDWITINNSSFIGKLISTLIVVLSLLLLRLLITRYIKKQEQYQPTTRRRWIVSAHNGFLVVLLVLLFVIWIEQLRILTGSLVLFAAAIVVATKEFILNIVGYFYRTGSNFISIGDRIEIGNLILRIPTQARKRGRIEQEISRKYLLNIETLKVNRSGDEIPNS